MKILITDIAGGCCPENVIHGSFDAEMAKRIEERVFQSIEPPKKSLHGIRRLVIVAAIISVLTGSAFAAVNYTMNFEVREQRVARPFHESGYAVVGGVISFDAPAEGHYAGFTASYLPCEPSHKTPYYDEDGNISPWCSDIDCDDGETIYYRISSTQSISGQGLVFGARLEPVREETVGDIQILEFRGEYDKPQRSVNYMLLFDRSSGFLISIASEVYDFAELEKIAAGMEICVFHNTNPCSYDYSYFDLGRG